MNNEKPLFYTCHRCIRNFPTKKCPICGQDGTPIYSSDLTFERPKNNPTDVDAFFKKMVKKKPEES